jgi:hypothetical protein
VAVVSDGSDVSRIRRPLMSQLRNLAALSALPALPGLLSTLVATDARAQLAAAVAHAAQDAVLARRGRLAGVSPAGGEVAE